jgi:hypothetical protein
MKKGENTIGQETETTFNTLEQEVFKLKEFFVYQEETNEALHYPSGQEEGN